MFGLGKICNGKIEIGTHITFATAQTLSKIDLTEYTDMFDVIVVDERTSNMWNSLFCGYVLQSYK